MSDPVTTLYDELKPAFEDIRERLKIAEGDTSIIERLQGKADDLLNKPEPRKEYGRAEVLAERFELDAFQRDLILLTAFAELEPDAADLIAAAQGNLLLQRPTVALAFSVLDNPHWSAFTPDSALRQYELLDLQGEGATQALSLVLPARILHFLLGVETIDETLLLLSRRLEADQKLAPSRDVLAKDLAARLAEMDVNQSPVMQLCGFDRTGSLTIAAAAVNSLDLVAYLMPVDNIPTTAQERAQLVRRWERELRLENAVLVLDASELADKTELRPVSLLADALKGRVIIVAAEPLALPMRNVIRIDVPRSLVTEQKQLWREVLGENSARLNGSVDRLANHFILSPGMMAVVNTELEHACAADPKTNLDNVAWSAARRQTRPQLDGLAKRIPVPAKWKNLVGQGKQADIWNEIVLPKQQLAMLKMVASQVRYRATVYEEWGFANRSQRGLGISACFSGGSGTGKTLAAEILGACLELDVYQIDLSSVVSKWVGETEKNLRRIFDAADESCAILLFDEADALFGKRSEVTSSHDRHANIEVSYLLQRLEAYRGLAILTTNLQDNIDDAFLRRIRFIVDFVFPDASERCDIWRNIFPEKTPVGDLQHEQLAQLNVAGGSIRNIAINAAFNAAGESAQVGMEHILSATRIEYEKIGRSLTGSELNGWPQ